MKYTRLVLVLSMKLIFRSKLYYIAFGVFSFIAFSFISLTINNSAYRDIIQYSSLGMDVEFIGSLNPYPRQVDGFKPFEEIFPNNSFICFDSRLGGKRCIAYDIRLAEKVEPILSKGLWPHRLTGSSKPVIVSKDLEEDHPIGSRFNSSIEYMSKTAFKGEFEVVGVLEKNAVVFDPNAQNVGVLYDLVLTYFEPNYSGYITFVDQDELDKPVLLMSPFLYDTASADYSKLDDAERIIYERSTDKTLSEIWDYRMLDEWRPFFYSFIVLWVMAITSVAGIVSIREHKFLIILYIAGIGEKSLALLLVIKLAVITFAAMVFGLLVSKPSFGATTDSIAGCILSCLVYTFLAGIASVLSYKSMEVIQ